MKVSPVGPTGPVAASKLPHLQVGRFAWLLAAAFTVSHIFHSTAFAVDAGDLDTTFSSDGIVLTNVGGRFDRGEAVAVQNDGKIVVAGSSRLGVNRVITVVRYNPDGSLDTDFDTDGVVTTPLLGQDDAAFGVAIQDNDKILVGGRTWNGANFDFVLVRYEADGSLDATFGASGIVTTGFSTGSNDEAFAIALQNDGNIILAGKTGIGLLSAFALARYNTDGSLDTTFGVGGLVVTDLAGPDQALSIALQDDDRIVAAGFSFNGVTDDVAIVRYQPNGNVDTGFGTNGVIVLDLTSSDERATGVAIQLDTRIVVSGFTNANGNFDFLLLRFLADGTRDTSLGGTGVVITDLQGSDDEAQDLTIQSDNKMVAVGSSTDTGSLIDNEFALVRYDPDGTLDSSFGKNGIVVTMIGTLADVALAVTLQADGRIVAAGVADAGPDTDITVARYRNVPGAQAAVAGGSSGGGGGCTTLAAGAASDYSLLLLLAMLLFLRRSSFSPAPISPSRQGVTKE